MDGPAASRPPRRWSIGWSITSTPKGQALAKAREIIAEIGKNAPLPVMLIKQAVDRGVDMSLADGLATENDISYLLTFSEDREEGLKAFREKRPPKFRGQ